MNDRNQYPHPRTMKVSCGIDYTAPNREKKYLCLTVIVQIYEKGNVTCPDFYPKIGQVKKWFGEFTLGFLGQGYSVDVDGITVLSMEEVLP